MEEQFQAYVWKKEYDIGIENIDSQHRELFRRIDKLLLAIYEGKEKNELNQLERFMIEYIHEHFSNEEAMLKLNSYPDIEEHKNEHREFITLYHTFREEMLKEGAGVYLANRMLRELRKWWENHILKSDMRYKPFVLEIDLHNEKTGNNDNAVPRRRLDSF